MCEFNWDVYVIVVMILNFLKNDVLMFKYVFFYYIFRINFLGNYMRIV